jgi:hypothetical protein
VNTKVPSLKEQGKEYDGFTITITGDKYVCVRAGLGLWWLQETCAEMKNLRVQCAEDYTVSVCLL